MGNTAILSGKVAIVTGSGQGIGKAISLAFAREGARVIVADVDMSNANQTKSELAGSDHLALEVDVRNPELVTQMIESTILRYGRIDISRWYS